MNNIFNMLNELRANPVQFLLQRRLNIPQDFSGGPQEIVQHLLNTGQVTQEQINQVRQYMSRIHPGM